MLVPVKGFSAAKQRLSAVLGADDRDRLARWLAGRVLAAVDAMTVYVACDDDDVREWADGLGARIAWGPGLGLNGAVDDGVARIADDGFDHVVVAHADLPFPAGLARLARPGTTTLVADRRLDGTNVMSFPLARPIAASYGAGSFRRHLEAATSGGGAVEVRTDVRLGLDIDTPHDLVHPLTSEVLPTWLPTIPVNPFTRRA